MSERSKPHRLCLYRQGETEPLEVLASEQPFPRYAAGELVGYHDENRRFRVLRIVSVVFEEGAGGDGGGVTTHAWGEIE